MDVQVLLAYAAVLVAAAFLIRRLLSRRRKGNARLEHDSQPQQSTRSPQIHSKTALPLLLFRVRILYGTLAAVYMQTS